MKSFDKNKDGVVTEVSFIHKVKFVKCIILDRPDDTCRAGLQWPGPRQEWLCHRQGAQAAQQEDVREGDFCTHEQGRKQNY